MFPWEDPVIDVCHDHTYAQRPKKRYLKKSYRLKRKVNTRQTVVDELRRRNMVSDEIATILENTNSEVTQELMKRIVTQKKEYRCILTTAKIFCTYIEILLLKRLQVCSQRFNLALPHPSVIRPWYSCIDRDPGLTKTPFCALSAKVAASRGTGEKVICSLLLDEMSVKKQFGVENDLEVLWI